MLIPLDLPPGIARSGTRYQSRNRWYDANLVRFLNHTIRPIGGWVPLTTAGLLGNPILQTAVTVATSHISVTVATGTLSGSIGSGATCVITGEASTPTHTVVNGPYYVATSGVMASIELTPAVTTVAISATVTFSGVGAPVVAPAAPRALLPWLSQTGGQAYLAIAHVQGLELYSEGGVTNITPTSFISGRVDSTRTAGITRTYGASYYGLGAYGTPQRLQGRFLPPDMWTLDTLSDWLVGVMAQSDGYLYVFKPGVDTLAKVATSYTGTAPTSCRGVVVTSEGFVMALGANDDPRLVKWASQGTVDSWSPIPTDTDSLGSASTAGTYQLETSGQLLVGKRGIGETLLFTDVDVIAAVFQGGTNIYTFANRGHNCGTISPGAVAKLDARFAWMGNGAFYMYDGYTHQIESAGDILDYVFSDFNADQAYKVASFSNPAFGEVWWFYPSSDATECDRYVIWNYRENHWNIGALDRCAGADPGNGLAAPVLVAPTGTVYVHETTWGHPGADVYLESGPFEIGDGDRTADVEQLVPDERIQGEVEATFYTQFWPNATEYTYGPYTMTNPTDVRFLGRSARIRLDQVVESDWRVGRMRLDVQPGGRR